MRKGRDGENGMEWNNDENSGPLTSLPVDRLTATDCNADACANRVRREREKKMEPLPHKERPMEIERKRKEIRRATEQRA